MGLMDGVLLTLINAAICIALPKLLSLIPQDKVEQKYSSSSELTAQEGNSEIPSFP